MEPVIQIALDFVNLNRAIKVAEEAVAGGADWLEAGTPLIKSEGLDAVRELRRNFPDHTVIADMKTMDAGRVEVETAAKAGANIVGVLGVASDATIKECIEAADNYGFEIIVDMIGVKDTVSRAKQAEEFGANYIGIHTAIDEQMEGISPFEKLRQVAEAVSIPIAVAGGINSETAADAVKAGASIVVVGGAIIKAPDAKLATQNIKKAIETGEKIETIEFKRVTGDEIRNLFNQVSTANISDVMHRERELLDIHTIVPGVKMVGKAVTVRTSPGDWAKPVQAIDQAKEGDVIVVDAHGLGPAVWGEEATRSCIQRKLAGIVINGAIRDSREIRELGFPAFAKLTVPAAGEPRGWGQIGVNIELNGKEIHPGDWIVGDDDGVMVIPKEIAVEVANRAMHWKEKETREMKEIERGNTLGKLSELLRWEKR
ncbi:bifunctional hexulose-6-phosphate synthase/ribonuclease regulator [Candidatus Poribacteria bacterium]|nr:bifunctional hexulose-6-phosphate synthase/ribonuclease regulator [Candidatus Poribacteria bacterium]